MKPEAVEERKWEDKKKESKQKGSFSKEELELLQKSICEFVKE